MSGTLLGNFCCQYMARSDSSSMVAPVVECKTFRAELIPRKSGDASDLEVSIKADAEWSDAREEASALLGSNAVSPISEKMEEAYQWLTKKEHLGRKWNDVELRNKFKVDPIWNLLRKLHFFNDSRIRITKKGYWDYEVFVSESRRASVSDVLRKYVQFSRHLTVKPG